jgi:hypothetical protein
LTLGLTFSPGVAWSFCHFLRPQGFVLSMLIKKDRLGIFAPQCRTFCYFCSGSGWKEECRFDAWGTWSQCRNSQVEFWRNLNLWVKFWFKSSRRILILIYAYINYTGFELGITLWLGLELLSGIGSTCWSGQEKLSM